MLFPRSESHHDWIEDEARKAILEKELEDHRSVYHQVTQPVKYTPQKIVVRKPWGELIQRKCKWGVITLRQLDGKRMWHGEFHNRDYAAKVLEEALKFDWVYYKERMQDDTTRTTAEHH